MMHASRLTLPRLLSLVEGHLRRILPGRMAVPNRAYAAAPSGAVSVIEFPAEVEDAEATAAILALEMARRDCRLFVLVQGEKPEMIRLDGHRIGRRPAHAARLLRIERAGRKIGGLRRADGRGPAGIQANWHATA